MGSFSRGLMITAFAAGVVGCGGGSSSSAPPASAPQAYTLTAIDGYLYKADVCIDANSNNVCDDGETVIGTTDELGSFDVPAENAGDKLVVRIVENKTIDQDDGLPIDLGYSLSAPIGSLVVTPFTHIAQVQNKTLAEVAADLGFSEEDISGDYIEGKEGTNSTLAKQVHKVAQYLADQLQSDAAVDETLITNATELKQAIDVVISTTPEADIENIDFEVDSEGNVTQTERPSLDYSFDSSAEYFAIWYNSDSADCGGLTGWIVEQVSYTPGENATSGTYGLSNCASSTSATFNETETGPFTADGNIMTWPNTNEGAVRLNYISQYKAFETCFFEGATAPSSCGLEGLVYEVEVANQSDAQALLDLLNAQDQAEKARLIGSWDIDLGNTDDYDKTILTFTADGEFFFFDIENDGDPCRAIGYEWGTYERNGDTINLSAQIDTNGCVGIFDDGQGETTKELTVITELENEISVSFIDPDDSINALSLDRIQTSSTSIVGAWHEPLNEGPNGDNNLSNLILFTEEGWFYFMDSDPTFVDENDFDYGDYSVSGSNLETTFRFSDAANETLNVPGTVGFTIENGRIYFDDPEENSYGLLQVAPAQ